MTAFELFFGLTSVILGLALAQLANSLQHLLRAGRKVKWSPEPVLLSTLILLILVSVWADQWQSRTATSFTVGECLLQVVKLLALFIAASAVLPDPRPNEPIDLRLHYFESRAICFGALISGLILFSAYRYLYGNQAISVASVGADLLLPALYASMILIRWRPWHLLVLSVVVVLFSYQIVSIEIGGR